MQIANFVLLSNLLLLWIPYYCPHLNSSYFHHINISFFSSLPSFFPSFTFSCTYLLKGISLGFLMIALCNVFPHYGFNFLLMKMYALTILSVNTQESIFSMLLFLWKCFHIVLILRGQWVWTLNFKFIVILLQSFKAIAQFSSIFFLIVYEKSSVDSSFMGNQIFYLIASSAFFFSSNFCSFNISI